jgi:uncharacterized Zn finger protein
MNRFFIHLAAFAVVLTSLHASAQNIQQQPYYGHAPLPDHDYWHHDPHTPDVVQLDKYADELAKVARHLHEDAHKLSQDYEHSSAIETYVDSLDRLQKHMHEILHEAVESGIQSTELIEHVKGDVRQVRALLSRLYREIQHQGYDGARTADFHAMSHMRQVIVVEASPLVRQTEVALYGYSLDDHHTSWRRSINSHGRYQHQYRGHH